MITITLPLSLFLSLSLLRYPAVLVTLQVALQFYYELYGVLLEPLLLPDFIHADHILMYLL